VVHVGYQLAQDRWSYRSGMGFALVMGGGLARLLDERARARVSAVITRTVLAGAAGIVFVLAAGAWDQSKIWQDSETLWRWAATLDPQCKMCWNNLGTALTGQQRHAEAEEAYRRAYAIRPYAAVANNIATALFNQGKTAQGEEMLREALHLDPDLTGALVNLGSQQARAGRFAEALPHLRRAYARDPVFPDAARVLTAALIGQAALELRSGRAPLAATLYREALAVQPGNAEAREGLDGLASTRVPATASDLRR
jgi:tetratricopeptide (TPR) repeat protein